MFKIRVDSRNPVHVRFTIFGNGANCGNLAMRIPEFEEFVLKMKDAIVEDIRTVYFCPVCGWESLNEEEKDSECMQDKCSGKLTGIKQERYTREIL